MNTCKTCEGIGLFPDPNEGVSACRDCSGTGKVESIMQNAIAKIMAERAEHLEKYAAAFVLQVGSAEASKYRLVEERSVDGLKTTWYFSLRENLPRKIDRGYGSFAGDDYI